MVEKIVEVELESGFIRPALDLGLDSNTKKRVVIFRYPGTNKVETRGYDSPSCLYSQEYEEVELTTSQEDYAINLLKQKGIWL